MDYGLLRQAVKELAEAGCETPQLDAEVLLAEVLQCERYEIYSGRWTMDHGLWTKLQDKIKLFKKHIERRKKREPVAYIIGYKEFWSLKIKVTSDVLIPRPETEDLVEKTLEKVHRPLSIVHSPLLLDLCTGSGCIAAALATELPHARFVVTDICEKALAVAKENLAFASPRVQFIQSDLFKNITGPFDLIVSNPPYIRTEELEGLAPEIKRYEPQLALDGGRDGLDFVRRILHSAPNFLKPTGWLILENGPEIQTLRACEAGFTPAEHEGFGGMGPALPKAKGQRSPQ